MELLRAADVLVKDLKDLPLPKAVTHVYNPLEYARTPYGHYVNRFGVRGCEIVLLGMNPGPYGMAQTGVPFGEISLVRDWMGIEAPVRKPRNEHPKRPIEGFACKRSEVSGARLWGWARDTYGTPERFFSQFFVANYCPLVFMEETGRNFTPDKLPKTSKQPLFEACDKALRRLVEHLRPKLVIGVGKFAEDRALAALGDSKVEIGRILHPSPASPLANKGWAEQAVKQLEALGVELPSTATA